MVIIQSESEVKALIAQSCPTLYDPTRPFCPWDSPRKNTGVGNYPLL